MTLRLSGPIVDRPAANAAVGAFYFATDANIVYVSDGNQWTQRGRLSRADVAGSQSGADVSKGDPAEAIGWVYHAADTGISYEAFPTGWFALVPGLSSMSPVQLRHWASGQFGLRLQSTGDAANLAGTFKIVETVDASPTNPYWLRFDQCIITGFTGPGQFDLVERDATDVDLAFSDCITVDESVLLTSVGDNFTADMVGDLVVCVGIPPGTTVVSYQNPKQVTLSDDATASAPDPGIACVIGGKSQVTLATKTGFTDGDTTNDWSRDVRLVTSAKTYSVIFVPGTVGDGMYSIRMSGLRQGQQ